MAEKNIAAMLDTMAFTIGGVYQHSSGETADTYVCNLPEISTGDFVVVPTKLRVDKNAQMYAMPCDERITPQLRKDAARMIESGSRLSIARVVRIDQNVDIEPNDEIEYSWVISKVDLTKYSDLIERNKQITDAVQDAYKRNLRKSFAERVLGELPQEDQQNLLKLLGR
jgi:hypothetical protein